MRLPRRYLLRVQALLAMGIFVGVVAAFIGFSSAHISVSTSDTRSRFACGTPWGSAAPKQSLAPADVIAACPDLVARWRTRADVLAVLSAVLVVGSSVALLRQERG